MHKSTDQLMEILDQAGMWFVWGFPRYKITRSLREALNKTRELSHKGITCTVMRASLEPVKIESAQIYELWDKLGLIIEEPVKEPVA